MNSLCDVAVIILNWRTAVLTQSCVRSVLDSPFSSGRMKLIVVDNESDHRTAAALRSKFGDKVEVIKSQQNRGYAGGMNIGLKRAAELAAKYSLLLNSDTRVHETAIEQLYRAAQDLPDGALFGTRIYDVGEPTCRWFVGGRWDWGQGTIRAAWEHAADSLSDEPRQMEFLSGAAMFVRMSALEQIGMFDERFGLYFEDSDLCSRAFRSGFTLWHIPRAAVWHVGGASISTASELARIDIGQYYRTRNRLLWGRKNLTGLRAVVFWLHIILRWPPKLLLLRFLARKSQALGLTRGVSDFLRGRYGMVAVGRGACPGGPN